MNAEIQIGTEYKAEMTVQLKDTAQQYGSGLLPVFATPAMIAFIENCCHKLLNKNLSKDLTSVGTEICIKHLKATKINDTVKCIAKVEKVEGKAVHFSVRVVDSRALIGTGTHCRVIVDKDKFFKKVNEMS